MTDTIKLYAKFPVKMTIIQFKKWYYDNKEAVHKLSSKYINHQIIIVDDKNNEYKSIRRKDEGQIVPREKLKSKQQIVDDVEQLKTLFKELEFIENKIRHYGDLWVLKGIDIEDVGENEGTGTKGNTESKIEYVKFGPV